MYAAATYGRFAIVRELLENGADPNVIAAGFNCAQTALFMACQEGYFEIVRLLLEYGADVSIPERKYKMTPVSIAASNGHVDVVRILLEHRADPNKARIDIGSTPVFIAAQKGHAEVVTLLLENKGDPNTPTTDKYGYTPLVIASHEGHIDVVLALIAGGADPNQKSKMALLMPKWTPVQHVQKSIMSGEDGTTAIQEALLQQQRYEMHAKHEQALQKTSGAGSTNNNMAIGNAYANPDDA